MKGIFKVEELPADAKIYLKKDFFGWRVVQPYKNEDGSMNWFNFITGGWKNLTILLLLLVFGYIAYMGVTELISNYRLVAQNPCAYCTDCQAHTRQVISTIQKNTFNFSFNSS